MGGWFPVVPAEDEMGMGGGTSARLRKPDPGCMSCHGGIEVMHPWDPLSCTDCHSAHGADFPSLLLGSELESPHVSAEIEEISD